MAMSPSDDAPVRVSVIGGGDRSGAPPAEEVAAVLAALEVVLGRRPTVAPPAVSAWRWSGRQWQWPDRRADGLGQSTPSLTWT